MTLQELACLYHLLYEQQVEIIGLREAMASLRVEVSKLERPVAAENGVPA